jgi:hypothetical protein
MRLSRQRRRLFGSLLLRNDVLRRSRSPPEGHHPILARIAETDTVFGARLRPGDIGLGETDVEDVEQWFDRAREAAGPKALITVRIDTGGDCAALLGAIQTGEPWSSRLPKLWPLRVTS